MRKLKISKVVYNIAYQAHKILVLIGLDLRRMLIFILEFPRYCGDYIKLLRLRRTGASYFAFGNPFPCLIDRHNNSGTASGHYFHQDLYVAKKIFEAGPIRHIDIGSRMDGFVAHVATFRKIEVMDIRPLNVNIENITFIQRDLMEAVPNSLIGCCDSISSLHAIEHFGLGRYNDEINWDGYLIGLQNISALLVSGGKFYLSIPIGPQRIEFNAHRIFSLEYIIPLINKSFVINELSVVDDEGLLHKNIAINETNIASNYSTYYGCGIFELTKI